MLSVDYRLAPEHVFPAAANDCYAAVKWAAENVDILGGNGRLAVGGESAGGNLAAVVCQMARDEASPKIGFQLLLYPVVDCDMSRQSYIDNAKDYILTTDSMHWFWNHYCPEQSARQHPRASPLRGELSGLPPALVVTAEFDPLRDEGAAYADALKAAGNDTRYVCYAGLVHDFFAQAQTFHACREAFDACCAELKRRLT